MADTPQQVATTVAKDASAVSKTASAVWTEFMAWLPVGNRKWFVFIALAFVVGWLIR